MISRRASKTDVAKLDAVQRATGYTFRDEAVLYRAFTHRSHGAEHNERLEFLGDSVLNCTIALLLYEKFPVLQEGELSRLRASLVSEAALAGVAEKLDIGALLVLGEGEHKTGGTHRPSILADALEALLGAVFLDGGFDAVRGVVVQVFGDALACISPAAAGKDAKTQLQEILQGKRGALPQYRVVAVHGAAHAQDFEVECVIEQRGVRVSGRGSSRRRAEQEAATLALQLLSSLK